MARWKPDAQGRLMAAAVELFAEQGYETTTVAEIATRAGLSKRTFFRHFADKREVLFSGGEEIEVAWRSAVMAAPAGVEPLEAVGAGFGVLADVFAARHPFARLRAEIVVANPELQERELIKLQRWAGSLAGALEARGVPEVTAALAAQTGLTVFHVAFGRWVAQEDPGALGALMDATLDELRAVLAAAPALGAAA